eukprot:8766936-Pyramimonas_sp.AAC.1
MIRVVSLSLLRWVVALLAAVPASSLQLDGYTYGADSWKYLGRFCFLGKYQHTEGKVNGKVTMKLTFPLNSRLTLLKYLEKPKDYQGTGITSFSSWSSIYNGKLNCSRRMELADKVGQLLICRNRELYLQGRLTRGTRQQRTQIFTSTSEDIRRCYEACSRQL